MCFANKGFKVTGIDIDSEKVKLINMGKSPFREPGLDELLMKALGKRLLHCTTNQEHALEKSGVSFITVGTPSLPDGSIDLDFVGAASQSIGEALKKMNKYHVVVVKSTVTPGTTEKVVKPIVEERSGKHCGSEFGLCVNPEFLKEGSAIHDMLNPDRIVIGEYDKRSGESLEKFYKDFYGESMPPIIRTNLTNSELIKYANNAFLATKISFINTIANICERLRGADVKVVAKGIGLDNRVSPFFLNAGLGYGGSCFPKDTKALIAFSKSLGYMPELVEAVTKVNEAQPFKAVDLAEKLIGNLKNKRIAILGLSFKPNTDDLRNAPSLKIVNFLLKKEAKIIAYDPKAMDNAKKIFGVKIEYASSAIKCIKGADCCIIITEWDVFRKLKPGDFIKHMKKPCIIDGRRIYNTAAFLDDTKFMAIGL